MRPLLLSLVSIALVAAVSNPVIAGNSAPAGSAAAAGDASLALRLQLVSGSTAAGERLLSRRYLRLFYAEREYRTAWSAGGRRSSRIDDLLDALRAADREGLRPEDYHIAAIDDLLARLRAAPGGDLSGLDLLLSDAFFLYATHLTAGRVSPESLEPEWNIAGRGRNLGFLLGAALAGDHLAATLRGLPPVREDYRLLRGALAAQRAIAAAGGWPLVPAGPALREGDRGPRVAALRARLAATGELPPGGDLSGELFDAPLAGALRRFQLRHGLDPDAVAGQRTLSALNTPPLLLAHRIEANLERLRWLPRNLGSRHLIVNVADFRLELTEGSAPPLAMRVIAGRLARRTPFFTGEIASILLNPTWTVPDKIAVEDKLPQIVDDRDFLKDHGFRVFAPTEDGWSEVDPAEVDWTSLSKKNFPYLLRQDAGPENALGRVKFQAPNRHDIYLHDTPSHGLFARAERIFSSGCIRVERAVDLAERLLAADPAWSRARIEATIAGGETVGIRLPEPLPFYLLYWTAWVDREGVLQLREDVYGRDAALVEALSQPVPVQPE